MEKKRVSIEIGHTYAHKDNLRGVGSDLETITRELTVFEKACAQLGEIARLLAEQQGLVAKTHVLVDDVEWAYRQKLSQEPWRWQLFRGSAWKGAEKAYQNSKIASEGDLRESAEQRIADLENHGERTKVRHIRLDTLTGKQRIKLRGYGGVDDSQHPSCDMLDLEWHIKRADESHSPADCAT